jgi:hypothetical protein
MAMKRQAQVAGLVNPDLAPIVAESLADTREKNYRDAQLGLQEQAGTLAERKQAAQESQFAAEMAQRGGQFDTTTAEKGRQFDARTGQQVQQFNDELTFKQGLVNDEISQANRQRTMDWLKLGAGAGLAGGYLYADPYKLRRG